ncbi:MAG: TrkH family potassium uptake protein [Longimicrobiales bacterium]|nr:TrkH family potassium uptake protein [Longimicrobiales bacterium]
MSLRRVLGVVGLMEIFFGIAMAAPLAVSLIYRDGDALAFLGAMVLTIAAGGALSRLARGDSEITTREGFAIVTLGWTGAAAFGALPYLFTGTAGGFWRALFESMSGLTTTGATIFSDIEALPRGILFWRSLTHWIGGMGIIVLAIAVLPYLGVGGMQLFRAEVPGPTPERLRPRIAQTAKLLWLVYLGMTLAQSLLYRLGGLDWFDAITHTFATLATGGFSTRNDSLAAFPSPFVQYVTILFMYLAGINFALHFRALTGRLEYFRDQEWRFLTGIILGSGLVLAGVNLVGGAHPLTTGGVEEAVRTGLFQSTSITTTTGFVSADYEAWLPAGQVILLALMFVGGMAGSTGGGIKAVRVLLLLKHGWLEVRKHLHPRAIFLTRVGRQTVGEGVMANIIGFVLLYLLLLLAGILVLGFMGMDLLTALGASAATVGNIGPGWGAVGATDHYGWMEAPALAVLTFLMLVGRLEIYTVLLLLLPETWRRRRPRSVRT